MCPASEGFVVPRGDCHGSRCCPTFITDRAINLRQQHPALRVATAPTASGHILASFLMLCGGASDASAQRAVNIVGDTICESLHGRRRRRLRRLSRLFAYMLHHRRSLASRTEVRGSFFYKVYYRCTHFAPPAI